MDIIGFISRSHGMDLRSTFSYLLEKHHDCRTPYNIKVIYLMVVIRISDYLHITPDRAPARILQISSFSSPVSILEWKLHQTIKDMNQNHEDPETLFVNARPSNSVEFLKLKSLFNNIQNEFDLSWAILGEVYGRYKELNKLKISIRRVRSNLENKSYIDSLAYLPKKAIFDSDSEVIKLLVSPLYGGQPSYGVRELIQNSVDACRELEYLYKTGAEIGEYKSEIKIGVYQAESDYFFQIEDNGIGMSAEVIVHYFFIAGASYRNNMDWKMKFTVDGDTQITRSGRFGVGILAAFLLGDQLEVTTKSINSERGYSFTASLDDVQIEVRNTIDRSVGTTIRIKLNEKSLLELKNQVESDYQSNRSEPAWFAWYVLNKPDIQYNFPDDWGRDGFNKYHTAADINDWKVIKVQRFGEVLWKYEDSISKQFYNPTLLCNGIIIPNGYRCRYPFYWSYPSMNQMPSVAVYDYKGAMPLELKRDKLDGNGELPFEKELSQSLILDMLAKLITRKTNSSKLVSDTTHFKHPLLMANKIVDEDGQRVDNLIGEGSLVLSKAGYCLPYTRNIKKLKTNKFVQIWTKTSQELSFNIWSYLEYVMICNHPLSHSNELLKSALYELSFIHDFRINSKRIYLPKQLGVALLNGEIKMSKDIWNKLKMEKEFGNMISITMNNPPSATIDDSFFESDDGLKVDTLIEIYIASKKFRKHNKHDKEKIEKLNKYVEEVLDKCFADGGFIPYDLKERREKFPQAFKYLSEYM
ncbi:hypothetical protein BK133_27475 [Paenibacillus sp. FSL H8-0548]|uniref:HD domain-containing protein n=1 Tax=Paenibacillus sp. FSL H8-0548 TaxID=1920422 RepID=UPI00096D549B|nr:ATP-binding protein [Paenibacillus sp. FSL H8-0548]OMF21913.1 hypothetical protein BK133_27475 [Paenibacillus sp. FSL H8-0548]